MTNKETQVHHKGSAASPAMDAAGSWRAGLLIMPVPQLSMPRRVQL